MTCMSSLLLYLDSPCMHARTDTPTACDMSVCVQDTGAGVGGRRDWDEEARCAA